jgi:hypothetical protein
LRDTWLRWWRRLWPELGLSKIPKRESDRFGSVLPLPPGVFSSRARKVLKVFRLTYFFISESFARARKPKKTRACFSASFANALMDAESLRPNIWNYIQ